jgi:magnesium-transporting ATPase (P-type)
MVKQDQLIPVDMLVVKASDPKGVFYVETKNLDGETNLKLKTTSKEL